MIDENKSTPDPKMGNKKFPPKLSPCQIAILTASYTLVFLGAIVTITELCFQTPVPVNDIFPFLNLIDTTCSSYVGIGFVLTGIIVDRIIRHDTRLHKLRLEDISVVKSIIITAKTFDSRNSSSGIDFEEKKKQLSEEVSRLINLTDQGWTEYQILPIQKMLVDFRSNDELIADARSALAELKDYVAASSYRDDKENYNNWEERIEKAEKLINEPENKSENASDKDISSYKLRTELKALIEDVTEYAYDWTVGSELVKNLIICSAAAIPLLIVSGLIPVIHPSAPKSVEFGFISWGFLVSCPINK